MSNLPMCVPACAACRDVACPRKFIPGPIKPKKKIARARDWYPNREPIIPVDCGHTTLAWPLFKMLGGGTTVWCDECQDWSIPVTRPKSKPQPKEPPF